MNKNYRLVAFYLVALITCGAIFGCIIVGFAAIPNNTIRQNAGAVMPTFNATGAGYFVGPDMIVSAARAASFVTLDTGQGVNELYPMDQGVRTNDDVQFHSIDVQELNLNSVPTTDHLTASLEEAANYIVYPSGGNYYAKNGVTGQPEFSGAVFDTVAQAAITAGAGGKIVFKGTFIKTTTTGLSIPSDTIVEIQGIIRLAPNVGNIPYIFKPENVDNIKIIGGVVDGNRWNHTTIVGNAHNIAFINVTNSEIAGVRSMNAGTTANDGYGFYINGGSYNTIHDCWDIYSKHSSYTLYNGANYCTIKNCYSINSDFHAFNIHTVSHVALEGNVVYSTGFFGVTLTSTVNDVIIQGNTISVVSNGIQETGTSAISNLNIIGNTFYRSAISGSPSTIALTSEVTYALVDGNNFYDPYIGIYSASPNAIISNNHIQEATIGIECLANNNLITGNQLYKTTTKGIWVQSASGVQIIHNVLEDCRSSAVYLQSATNTVVESNKFIKGFSATGIYNDAGCTETVIRNNDLRNGATTILINNLGTVERITGNEGYITEISSTATILNGTTSIVINHGLSYTPTSGNTAWTVSYLENPTNDPGSWYIDTFTATQATIHVLRDPGISHLDIAWSARRTP